MDFKPVAFKEISIYEIRPSVRSSKYNEHYSDGALLALQVGKNSLLISMRYTPTEKGKQTAGAAWSVPSAEVEFQLFQDKGWYIGGIRRQSPGDFCWWSGPSASAGKDLHYLRRVVAPENDHFKPRHKISFSVRRKGAPSGIDPDCHFDLYLRPALLGGWNEIVVLPAWKDVAYVAHP